MAASFILNKNNHSTTRAHDYLYDPTFTVSTAKDFYRHAMVARMRCAQYEICPIFENMFSDLPSQPSHQLALRKGAKNPKNLACEWPGPEKKRDYGTPLVSKSFRPEDIVMYYKCPVIQISSDIIPLSATPKYTRSEIDDKEKTYKTNKSVQTIYRDSSAQTKPWQPEANIKESDLEILKLQFLQENLPAGMKEIELIQRARRRRAWEKLLPEELDPENLEKRRHIAEAIETDEWAFREHKISEVQNLRMQLLENMLQELLNETANRTEAKLQRIAERLNKNKEEKLAKIRSRTHQELRRLEKQYKGIQSKYHTVPIIEEYCDPASEMYAPIARHGVHPNRGHEIIDTEQYTTHLIDIEKQSTIPDWALAVSGDTKNVKLKGRHLCIRETKWTEPILKQLHNELKNLRQVTKLKCNLRKRIIKVEIHHETLEVLGPQNPQEEFTEAILLLQSVIRGRCIQSRIYEGRDKCRGLITELQNTFPLQEHHAKKIHEERIKVMKQQRKQQINNIKKENMQELLAKLQGTVVGTLLDFLNKEYRRLLDERKCHAIALLHERDRRDREAAEGGRRQLEERRRKEHDEIFKQVVKVHQDTVDLYLQEIITEGAETVSEEQANQYIKKLAKQLDEEQMALEDKLKNDYPSRCDVEKQEIISNMVHHFIIPEAQKTIDREKLKQKQQSYLKNAHKLIYECEENYYKKLKDNELSVPVGGDIHHNPIGGDIHQDSWVPCDCTPLMSDWVNEMCDHTCKENKNISALNLPIEGSKDATATAVNLENENNVKINNQ